MSEQHWADRRRDRHRLAAQETRPRTPNPLNPADQPEQPEEEEWICITTKGTTRFTARGTGTDPVVGAAGLRVKTNRLTREAQRLKADLDAARQRIEELEVAE